MAQRHEHYRSAVISMPSSAQLASGNPRSLKPYDPRDFQLAAQTQAIYEKLVMDAMRKRSFRQNGYRIDEALSASKVRELLSRAFAIATKAEKHVSQPRRVKGTKLKVAVQPWLQESGRVPTPRTANASRERYTGTYIGSDGKRRTLTDLVNTRQAYEETLGKARQGKNFYRIVPEPTKAGIRYFVWPMPSGCYDVGPGTADLQTAQVIAADLNRKRRVPWQLSRRTYTKTKLAHWLPPLSAFEGKTVTRMRTRRTG